MAYRQQMTLQFWSINSRLASTRVMSPGRSASLIQSDSLDLRPVTSLSADDISSTMLSYARIGVFSICRSSPRVACVSFEDTTSCNNMTIVYRSLNSTAPHYLAADLRRLCDMPSRRRLRSSLTDQLNVQQSQCSTVGYRALAVAGARLWNSLPHDIAASDTLSWFRRELKTFYLDSHILCFSFFSLRSLWFLFRPC